MSKNKYHTTKTSIVIIKKNGVKHYLVKYYDTDDNMYQCALDTTDLNEAIKFLNDNYELIDLEGM